MASKYLNEMNDVDCGKDCSVHSISCDPAFLNILKKAERAAKSDVPILIEGASGTGKELLAKQIHQWSGRKANAWVAVNCAALPAGLLESELFGFDKGAFTGASADKPGRFEQASGGTILLDEIGEMDSLLQAKLLRVLEEQEIDHLGGRKPFKINVRIIATTNKDLEKLVRMGRFREDLFYRLYGVRFILPALRERRGDVILLARRFLRDQISIQNRSLQYGDGVLGFLETRKWCGNIRELKKSVERAAILSESGKIEIEHFEFSDESISAREQSSTDLLSPASIETRPMKEMEMEIILKALSENQGNRTRTAEALKMSLRTLRHKLKVYRDNGASITPAGKGSFHEKSEGHLS